MTDELALRPVAEDDLAVLEKLTQDPQVTGEFAWFGWFDLGRYRRMWAENRLISEDGGALMVVRDSERLGFVGWGRRQVTPVGYCWTMGIGVLPQHRGQGYGTQAHRLLARYLFSHTPVHRIEAATEVGNSAEQKALERAGFSREGVMRGFGWRDGAWRDGVTYSLLRTDPQPWHPNYPGC
jgi:RimJ/RimL family protein N-acetyltransferase